MDAIIEWMLVPMDAIMYWMSVPMDAIIEWMSVPMDIAHDPTAVLRALLVHTAM